MTTPTESPRTPPPPPLSDRRLKVAIVTPLPWFSSDPSRFSIDLALYIRALRSLGHEGVLVCPAEGSEFGGEDYDTIAVPLARFSEPAFWKSLGLDIAVMLNWLRYPEILHAMKEAGVFAVSRGDTDGVLSARLMARPLWERTVLPSQPLLRRLAGAKHFLTRYTSLYREEDAEKMDSLRTADAVLVETETARRNVAAFVAHYGAPDLAARLHILPHFVSDDILQAPVLPRDRKRAKVVAIGRWQDWQKDTPLLRAALTRYLYRYPETEIILIGRNNPADWEALTRTYPSVRVVGPVPREEIKSHLADARVLLLSSQYETFHIAAHEGLCLGCTVVGPPTIPVPDIVAHGSEYGTLALTRQPEVLATALEQEMSAWEHGERNPEAIAHHWRPYLSAERGLSLILSLYKNTITK